jgi:hypothetical protein
MKTPLGLRGGALGVIRRLASAPLWHGASRRRRVIVSGLLVAGIVGLGGTLVGAASANFIVGLFKPTPIQAVDVTP